MTDWRRQNRANWDERVAIHLADPSYDLAELRAGRGRLYPIEETELGPVDGLSILHLQCHFGRDTLALAQRGADVVGVDFSAPAIATARELAAELGLAHRARFVECDLFDAPGAVAARDGFDLVFTTWGTIGWLPDIRGWAAVVAQVLKPGGALYFADAHPAALVFDDLAPTPDGRAGRFLPYFNREVYVDSAPRDYTGDNPPLSTPTHEWMHTLSDIVNALIGAGLRIAWLNEHARLPWPMFAELDRGADGMYGWPDRPWLPLALSLRAERPG